MLKKEGIDLYVCVLHLFSEGQLSKSYRKIYLSSHMGKETNKNLSTSESNQRGRERMLRG